MQRRDPDDDDAAITPGAAWRPIATRWWVLGIYSYISALQSLLWMTWSSVPDASKTYLGTDDATLDLWLNFGPIAYCGSVTLAAWLLLARPDGVRLSVLLGAGLCAAAALVRCAPLVLPPAQRAAALGAVALGQFLNAAVAPLVVASPAFLSLLWFPASQRNLATAVGNVANAVGRGVGFFLGPALVSASGDLPTLLLVELGLAVLPLVCALAYYPALPEEPPSPAAAAEFASLRARARGGRRVGGNGDSDDGSGAKEAPAESVEDASSDGHGAPDEALLGAAGAGAAPPRSLGASLARAAADVLGVLRTPGLLLLTAAGGLQMAVYGAWSGTLPSVLSPRFSNADAGALGCVNTFAGVAGGLAVGALTDHPSLQHSLKAATVGLCVASAALFGALALALGPAAVPSVASGLSFGALAALCAAAGGLRGGADPLFFELSAELSHPAPAGTAGAVLTFWYHLALVAALSVPPAAMAWSMVAMSAALGVAAALLLPVAVSYQRR